MADLRRLCLILFAAISLPCAAGSYDEILTAANLDNTEGVVDLIQRGMDVNTTDLSGNTLLMIAARNGNATLLDYLLRNRANTLKRNKYGDTALMLAVFQGRTEIVRRMLDAKVQISGGGWNPLHYAAFGGHAEIAAMLVDRMPDIDAPAPNGQTALMLAAAAGHLDVVMVLVDADADMDLEDYEGLTAIALAIKAGRESVVDYLRSEGADE